MDPLRVSALRSVDLGVTDVSANAEFYSSIWQLEQVAQENGSVYLRGTGPSHHILALHESPAPAIMKVTFQAPDRSTIDALHARAKGLGVADIDLMEFQGLVSQSLDPTQRLALAVAQVVHHDELMARVQQFNASVAADVARPTGYQYSHGVHLLVFLFFVFKRV